MSSAPAMNLSSASRASRRPHAGKDDVQATPRWIAKPLNLTLGHHLFGDALPDGYELIAEATRAGVERVTVRYGLGAFEHFARELSSYLVARRLGRTEVDALRLSHFAATKGVRGTAFVEEVMDAVAGSIMDLHVADTGRASSPYDASGDEGSDQDWLLA